MSGLAETSLGLAQGTLRLVDHDPAWAAAFAAEVGRLAPRLPPGAAFDHIGSTAVPDLSAKPILDLALTCPAADHARAACVLVDAGYLDRGERSGRLFIRMAGPCRTHNLHLYGPEDHRLVRQIVFRDRLRADPALRAAYAAEKRRILESGTARRDYAEAKTDFIRRALND